MRRLSRVAFLLAASLATAGGATAAEPPRYLNLDFESPGYPREGIDFRSLGAIPVQHGFYRTRVAHDYDLVVSIDRTTASRPFRGRGGR